MFYYENKPRSPLFHFISAVIFLALVVVGLMLFAYVMLTVLAVGVIVFVILKIRSLFRGKPADDGMLHEEEGADEGNVIEGEFVEIDKPEQDK